MRKCDMMNFSLRIFHYSTTRPLKGQEVGPQLTATAAELPKGVSWLNPEGLQIPPTTATAADLPHGPL